jgi:alpha-maltose-1-phosphate synthase
VRILVLAEGDPETLDSWSGTSLSVVRHLRALGHDLRTGDADLMGWERAWAVARAFSPNRKRWWVKYHLGAGPFRRRSRRAGRHISANPEIDLIYQFGATFAPAGREKTPYVLYCDGNIELAWKARAVARNDASVLCRSEADQIHRREAQVYRGAAAILTISERLRESFIEDFEIPPDRVTTVYAGPNFDTSEIPIRPPRREATPPTVLFIGRQFFRKGGDLLLKAFQGVRRRLPDARLVIVGPTEAPAAQEGVEFRGFIDKSTPEGETELRSLYSDADLFCMPSRFEGFAISFLEAMFFGLPCVSTRAPWTPPEMIVDGETGFLVEPEDVGALEDRMVQLLSDPELALEMGRKGRTRVEENFTWPVVAQRMEAALKKSILVR